MYKDMGWTVCGSYPRSPMPEVTSNMTFTDKLGAVSKQQLNQINVGKYCILEIASFDHRHANLITTDLSILILGFIVLYNSHLVVYIYV